MVFQKMRVSQEANSFFDSGQYLLADSAYALSMNCIPAYKSPAANIPINTEFNYCIAKARRDMQDIIQWVNACVTLHNMLAQLGDAWEEMESYSGLNGPQRPSKVSTASEAKDLQSQVQAYCIEVNYANGTLPIV
ncbi:hypothetical protein PCASD_20235 [Puccinia coronata f. sp. avenae]|uniref:DDE Tnp4 domain-containing protein n=1 Tax=Puccinia coronata f. sp. avenae TaxID=200324 RepID=A0A2N5TS26_9BASI|nr:hypothetical protein PCASD_20235 [Puccinia coronata f. sp. avenae]